MTEKQLTLQRVSSDEKTKCGMCGFRVVDLWKLGKTEDDEFAVCGDCMMEQLISENAKVVIGN